MLGQSAINVLIIDGTRSVTSVIHRHISSVYPVAMINNKHQIEQYLPESGLVMCAETDHNRLHEWLYHIRRCNNDIPIVIVTERLTLERLQSLLGYRISRCFDSEKITPEQLNKSLYMLMREAAAACQVREDHLLTEARNEQLQDHISSVSSDLQAGRVLQRKMLPDSPLVIGQSRFEYQALPSLFMSGDFVDYMPLDDDGRQALFCIADVAGHGPSSAMLTILIKSSLLQAQKSVYSTDASDQPDSIESGVFDAKNLAVFMSQLNSDILALGLEQHLTMVVGYLDNDALQTPGVTLLNWCIAGHLPQPLLQTPSGAQFLRGMSAPLGIYPHMEFEISSMQLIGDWCLNLFTDGIFDLLPEGGLSDKRRALSALASECRFNIQTIEKTLLQHQDIDTLVDDVTFLAIRPER
ncbi:Phosphoserine phosphatase RsbP [BD1-7 clade bacterium]|uniref:Phosphoserine phosphatase RsbP n=1 Tax=BD1-7 clade bacterium TaxID=2029982 RepID=A0A5S9P1X0_9GAMM|nr:Phosphoserine phosphatase RsbP [BD1-7 clade bacterium]CAA0122627.1 Phosphoserine phosphatase RsbP [BD1-7 clade bacterium]